MEMVEKNPWINLSQLAERELKRIRMLEEHILVTYPECGNPKIRFDKKHIDAENMGLFISKKIIEG